MRTHRLVRDLMTLNPVTVSAASTLAKAAEAMRDHHIGCVLVRQEGRVFGLLTDRDIVVRAVASNVRPESAPVGEFCSRALLTCSPTDDLDQVLQRMQQRAVRRVPVLEGESPVGILSLGDVAAAFAPESVLGAISAAPPNI